MNTVTVIGRLTENPASRTVACDAGPRSVAKLSLAVPPERGRDGEPCYIDIEVWGATAGACAAHLAKGRRVAVTGRLALDRWTAEDGTHRRAHRIVAASVEFLDRPAAQAAA